MYEAGKGHRKNVSSSLREDAESQHFRIFFNWDKTKTLKQNLEILNAFERIQITEVDGILKVE